MNFSPALTAVIGVRTGCNPRSTSEGPVPEARTAAELVGGGDSTKARHGAVDVGPTTDRTKTEIGNHEGRGGLRSDRGDGIPLPVVGHRRRREGETETRGDRHAVQGQRTGFIGHIEDPFPRHRVDAQDAPGSTKRAATPRGEGVAEAALAKTWECRASGPGTAIRQVPRSAHPRMRIGNLR